ncbi:MAG: cysteine desulfurase [Polyangiaceae bacterium]
MLDLRDAFTGLVDGRGTSLTYLDSAATTPKPQVVVDALVRALSEQWGSAHRATYGLAAGATAAYEKARARVSAFLGDSGRGDVVFVRGATEALNLVAEAHAKPRLRPGDSIVVSILEHHSNLLPWRRVAEATGARLVVVPADPRGDLRPEDFERVVDSRTRVVAVTHVSNVLGSVVPAHAIGTIAKARGATFVLDGAQSIGRMPVDVTALGCDVFVASGHKVYGPPGIGFAWMTHTVLDGMGPWHVGGGMVSRVDDRGAEYVTGPLRFEAGTPNVVGAVGLARALDFVESCGREKLRRHESNLAILASRALRRIPRVRVLGDPRHRAGIVSFTVDGIHPHDLATVADSRGIALRAGHHCAEPLLRSLGTGSVVRASFGAYSVEKDVGRLAEAVVEALSVLS